MSRWVLAPAAVAAGVLALTGCASSPEPVKATLSSTLAAERLDPIAAQGTATMADLLAVRLTGRGVGATVTGRAARTVCTYSTATRELDRGVTNGLTWDRIEAAAAKAFPGHTFGPVESTSERWQNVRATGPDGTNLDISSRDITTIVLRVPVTDNPCETGPR